MINLLTQYTIKTKIKIIAFSAMIIIISLLTALILFSEYLSKQEIDFHKNQTRNHKLNTITQQV